MKRTIAPRSVDPHAVVEDEPQAGRRGKHATDSIMCCQCGTRFAKTSWDKTVAAFQEHEEPCFATYQASRAAREASLAAAGAPDEASSFVLPYYTNLHPANEVLL